jgi:hypothetical protein
MKNPNIILSIIAILGLIVLYQVTIYTPVILILSYLIYRLDINKENKEILNMVLTMFLFIEMVIYSPILALSITPLILLYYFANAYIMGMSMFSIVILYSIHILAINLSIFSFILFLINIVFKINTIHYNDLQLLFSIIALTSGSYLYSKCGEIENLKTLYHI